MASEAPIGLSAGDLRGGSHRRLSAEGFRCLGQKLRLSPDGCVAPSSASPRLLLKGNRGVVCTTLATLDKPVGGFLSTNHLKRS